MPSTRRYDADYTYYATLLMTYHPFPALASTTPPSPLRTLALRTSPSAPASHSPQLSALSPQPSALSRLVLSSRYVDVPETYTYYIHLPEQHTYKVIPT